MYTETALVYAEAYCGNYSCFKTETYIILIPCPCWIFLDMLVFYDLKMLLYSVLFYSHYSQFDGSAIRGILVQCLAQRHFGIWTGEAVDQMTKLLFLNNSLYLLNHMGHRSRGNSSTTISI